MTVETSLAGAVARRAGDEPDAVALTFLTAGAPPQPVRRGRLHAAALVAAGALRREGVRPGDLVVVAGEHDEASVAAFVGALYLGAVPCVYPYASAYGESDLYRRRLPALAEWGPVRAVLTRPGFPADAAAALAEAGCAVIPTGTGHAPEAEPLPAIHRADPDAPAYIQFSSGTTGEPKAAVVSHRAALHQLHAFADAAGLAADDVFIGWVPFYHDMGLVVHLLLPLVAGVPSVLMSPQQWVRRPQALLRAVPEHRATSCSMPNFGYAHTERAVRDPELAEIDLSGLRRLMVGAELVQASTMERFTARFAPCGLRPGIFRPAYGMAECVLTAAVCRPERPPRIDFVSRRALLDERRAAPAAPGDPDARAVVGCGAPVAGTTLLIVDEAGAPLPERRIGEIVVSAPYLFDGYLHRPELTAEALRDEGLHTGDLGYRVGDELFVVDRRKDLIISAGRNIYPESLERIAVEVLGDRAGRTAAFGVPDEPTGTELPVVVCECRGRPGEAEQEQFRTEVRRRTGRELGVPLADVRIVRRGWLPVTTSGKVARGAARGAYEAAGFRPAPGAALSLHAADGSVEAIEQALRRFFAQALRMEDVSPDEDLFALGMDSLRLVELALRIEDGLGRPVPMERFVERPTPAHLACLLAEPAAAAPPPERPRSPTHRYSRNRVAQRFWARGPMLGGRPLPYDPGRRLQQAWLSRAWVQERFFRAQVRMVRYETALVRPQADPEPAVLRSLMSNLWPAWRREALRDPEAFARWVEPQGGEGLWPPPADGRGTVYALVHTTVSSVFVDALDRFGVETAFITWGREGAAGMPFRSAQLFHARQVLLRGGAVVMFADGWQGVGGIEVPFFGRRRPIRPGAATLAVSTGARLVPVFPWLDPGGRVVLDVASPLTAEDGPPPQRVEALLHGYAELLRARWPLVYPSLWWTSLRRLAGLPGVGNREPGIEAPPTSGSALPSSAPGPLPTDSRTPLPDPRP